MDLSSTPRAIKVAAALVALEAVTVFVYAVAGVFAIDSDRLALGLTNALFFTLYAAGLGFCAWGFARLRTWSRSLIVMAQILQIGVAIGFKDGSTTWVAIVLGVVAIVVLLIVFAPATTDALYGERDDPTTESDRNG